MDAAGGMLAADCRDVHGGASDEAAASTARGAFAAFAPDITTAGDGEFCQKDFPRARSAIATGNGARLLGDKDVPDRRRGEANQPRDCVIARIALPIGWVKSAHLARMLKWCSFGAPTIRTAAPALRQASTSADC